MIDAKRKMNKRMRGRVGEARQDEARGNEKAASRSGWQRVDSKFGQTDGVNVIHAGTCSTFHVPENPKL